MNISRLQLFRAAARVERMHTVPPLYKQTDGEHTFGVLALLDHVYPEAPLRLWRAALYHDVPETVNGDTPSPALHRHTMLRDGMLEADRQVNEQYAMEIKLDTLEKRILKFCDRMELAIFCVEEADSGNIKMLRLYYRCMHSIVSDRLTDITVNAAQLFDYVKTYVERYYGDQEERLSSMFHGTPNL